MTFGKDAPPLPMYQPVKLKHVPTMVRRRYEKFDANKIQPNTTHVNDEDLVTNDKKSEGDTDAEMDAYASLDMDSSAEDETEDIGHETSCIEQDTSEFTGSTSEDSNRNGEQFQKERPDNEVAKVIDDERHNNGYESSGDKHGHCKREDDSLNNAHLSLEEVAVHIEDDCGSSVIVGDCEIEDNILQDAIHDPELNVDVAHDCQQRKNEISAITEESIGAWSEDVGDGSTKTTGHCKSEDNGLSDTHHSDEVNAVLADDYECSVIKCTIDENSFQDPNPTPELDAVAETDCHQADKGCAVNEDNTGELDNGSIQLTGSQTEDTNSKDDRTAVAIHVCNLDSDIEDESQSEVPDINDGFGTQEDRSKDDGAGDVKAAPDTGVRNEALNSVQGSSDSNEPGSPSKVSNSEGDGAEDQNSASSFGYSPEDNEKRFTKLDNQQEQEILKHKFTEEYGADNLISRNIDSVLERHSDKADDMDLACDNAHVTILNSNDSSNVEIQDEAHHCNNNEHVSNPKTIRNSEEEDSYELCCPICKQCITRTIIFQSREMIEDSRTTCFSWLISQICCIGK